MIGAASVMATEWNSAIDIAGMHATAVAGSKLRTAISAELDALKIPTAYIVISFLSVIYLSAMPRIVDHLKTPSKGDAKGD